jgi:TP53 regulating kinase and related kinases
MAEIKDFGNNTFETNIGKLFIRKELGKGKSGYSYLAELDKKSYILKVMHNEPCEYYSFGDKNKVLLEVNDYHKLKTCGILLPKLITYNAETNYLVKEFIDGQIASQMIAENQISETILKQLFDIYHCAKNYKINIDYFPSNFVIKDNKLYYIDYECNPYIPKWDLPNWGIYYWANSEGFKEYLRDGNITMINDSSGMGIPIKKPFEEKVFNWIRQFDINKSK